MAGIAGWAEKSKLSRLLVKGNFAASSLRWMGVFFRSGCSRGMRPGDGALPHPGRPYERHRLNEAKQRL
ncbi:MAG: hypothetical protein ACM3VX_04010, partial [Bacteroidota bacterium]